MQPGAWACAMLLTYLLSGPWTAPTESSAGLLEGLESTYYSFT